MRRTKFHIAWRATRWASLAMLLVCNLPSVTLALDFQTPRSKLPGRRIGAGTRASDIPSGGGAGSPAAAPSREIPGRRQGAGSRGGSRSRECIQGTPSQVTPQSNALPGIATQSPPAIVATLLPDTNVGLTTSGHPQFFWFMPQNNAEAVEFSLYSVNATKADQDLIYRTTSAVSGNPGIASVKLPAALGVPALEVGKEYRWYVSVICDSSNPSSTVTVNGWVQRVATNSDVNRELQRVIPGETSADALRRRIPLLAKHGLWFDLTTAIADLRCLAPNDQSVLTDWNQLLQSVKLEAIANQPLVQSCPTVTAPQS